MTPDGRFPEPARPRPTFGTATRVPGSFKLLIGAVVVAFLAGTAAVAALALWIVSMLLPVVLVAGGVAYATFKYRQWRGGTASRRFVRR